MFKRQLKNYKKFNMVSKKQDCKIFHQSSCLLCDLKFYMLSECDFLSFVKKKQKSDTSSKA